MEMTDDSLSILACGTPATDACAPMVRRSARVSGADIATVGVPRSVLIRAALVPDDCAQTARESARVSGEDIETAVALAPVLLKTANAMVAVAPKNFVFIS